ncbi:MAG: hypothetical protein A4E19_17745 [Nitrospira sp. SG-bin1]|nr:MAG: hypothetical protein A4E19_17745 [Nitrospira sp. SG-bin1]
MKNLLRGIATLGLITIVGGLWWMYNSLDAQIASAIRRYGPDITGVPVSLSDAKTDLVDGRAALHGLVVGNPEGFRTAHALSLGEISMTLDIGSLTTDVIRIKELTLIKPEITYEYAGGGSNLDVLQRNIERSIGRQDDKRKNSRESESGKKLVIEHLYIKNGTARVSVELLDGDAVQVPIPDMHLRDIGKKSNGTTAGEATRQVLGSLVPQVSTAVASLGVNVAGKTIQKGMETATQTIKDLFK